MTRTIKSATRICAKSTFNIYQSDNHIGDRQYVKIDTTHSPNFHTKLKIEPPRDNDKDTPFSATLKSTEPRSNC